MGFLERDIFDTSAGEEWHEKLQDGKDLVLFDVRGSGKKLFVGLSMKQELEEEGRSVASTKMFLVSAIAFHMDGFKVLLMQLCRPHQWSRFTRFQDDPVGRYTSALLVQTLSRLSFEQSSGTFWQLLRGFSTSKRKDPSVFLPTPSGWLPTSSRWGNLYETRIGRFTTAPGVVDLVDPQTLSYEQVPDFLNQEANLSRFKGKDLPEEVLVEFGVWGWCIFWRLGLGQKSLWASWQSMLSVKRSSLEIRMAWPLWGDENCFGLVQTQKIVETPRQDGDDVLHWWSPLREGLVLAKQPAWWYCWGPMMVYLAVTPMEHVRIWKESHPFFSVHSYSEADMPNISKALSLCSFRNFSQPSVSGNQTSPNTAIKTI